MRSLLSLRQNISCLLLFLFLASCGGKTSSPAETDTASASTDLGKEVYNSYCLTCHQANGTGVPGMNPPLRGTDWVTGDKSRLINVLLNGLNEELEINGETYENAMPAHDFLTDKQIAAVLSYVRSNFGNDATAITAEEVAALR